MQALISAMPVTRHITANGSRIYTLTLEAFPHFTVNAFLVVVGRPETPTYTALVDTGSSLPASTDGILAGLAEVRALWEEALTWERLSRVVVTHAHPDHLAGLPFVRSLTSAPIAAHALDVEAVAHPEAARDAALQKVEATLAWAGIGGEYAERLRRRAGHLTLPQGMGIDTPLSGGERLDGHFLVVHTPGHAPGQVCLQLDDVLLSADHLLPQNSPPLMPERAQAHCGLAAYLSSLARIEALHGVTVALGGHGGLMSDWRGRVQQLRERYDQKLEAVVAAATLPLTVQALTLKLYPNLRREQALLLLDQTGALVEYLVQTGRLGERNAGSVSVFQRV